MKKIVIILIIIISLVVGYSLFSGKIAVTGTANATGDFSIVFESLGNVKQVGSSGATAEISENKKDLKINVPKLSYPGAYVEVVAFIKNTGDIAAKIKGIEVSGTNNNNISISYYGINQDDKLLSKETKEIKIKIKWNEDSVDNSSNLSFVIAINYEQDTTGSNVVIPPSNVYREPILNGADPVLDNGMIPIYFDGNTAKKADVKERWYSYENKDWANVVLVSSERRSYYQNAPKGTVIEDNDVLSYLVWIPRYKYKLFNVEGKAGITPPTIEVIFENNSFSKTMGSKNGEYLSHPGFTFGNQELNGMWVGKFETTGTADNPTIKPLQEVLESQNVSSQFETAQKLKSDIYGLSSESRMARNSDWGAIAYLSQSLYGINAKIRRNNNTKYTGCGALSDDSAGTSTCEIKYAQADEYPQSTTGNITGIFDMSGGHWENVMGVLGTADGVPRSGYKANSNSGFTGFLEGDIMFIGKDFPDNKYYNVYDSTVSINKCGGKACLGHALDETRDWYNDIFAGTLSPSSTWYVRGAAWSDPNIAGIFAVSGRSGGTGCAFRIVIGM